MHQTLQSKYDLLYMEGMSAICANEESEAITYNVQDKKDNIILQTLEIGNLLEKSIDDNEYVPLSCHDGLLPLVVESRGDLRLDDITNLYKDDNCIFLKNKLTKPLIIEACHKFISSFGTFGFYRQEETRAICSIFEKSGLLSKTTKFSFTPLFIMLHELYDLYYSFKYPDKFSKKMADKKKGTKIAGNIAVIHSMVDLTAFYTEFDSWHYVLDIRGFLEAIKFIFIDFLINNNESPKQCAYCDKYFISDNPRAIYCSPVCRNRANVKKNYEKKRQEKDGE